MGKEVKEVNEVINPFNHGVTYNDLVAAMGSISVEEYLKDICSKEEIEFVKKELTLIKIK